jgi:hypothetical protein
MAAIISAALTEASIMVMVTLISSQPLGLLPKGTGGASPCSSGFFAGGVGGGRFSMPDIPPLLPEAAC